MFSARKCVTIVMATRSTFTRFHLSTASSGDQAKTLDMAYSVYDDHLRSTSGSDDDRIPVVVGHGILGSRNNWHSLAKAMNKRTNRKIYTVDFRCHGESPHHKDINYNVLSDDMLHFVTNQLRLTRIAFVGHSLGGLAALYAAIKRPEMVECVTSVDMSLERFAKPDETIKYLDAMLAAKWDPTLTVAAVRKDVDAQLTESIPITGIRQWLLTNLIHDGTTVRWTLDLPSLRRNCKILFGPVDIQGSYSGPTLYLCGGKSNFVRESHHQKILARFPNSRFENVPDAGHWLHSDKPEEFLEIQCRFLNEIHEKNGS